MRSGIHGQFNRIDAVFTKIFVVNIQNYCDTHYSKSITQFENKCKYSVRKVGKGAQTLDKIV